MKNKNKILLVVGVPYSRTNLSDAIEKVCYIDCVKANEKKAKRNKRDLDSIKTLRQLHNKRGRR